MRTLIRYVCILVFLFTLYSSLPSAAQSQARPIEPFSNTNDGRIWDSPTAALEDRMRPHVRVETQSVAHVTQIGALPFVTILCRFADSPTLTPHPISYYQGLMANTYPGMDYYIRQMSYGQCTLAGSTVVGWYNLPHPKSYYLTALGDFDTNKLPADATALATTVDFTKFFGINLVVNDAVPNGGSSFGSYHRQVTIKGVTSYFGVTYMQPTADNQGSFAHEMGHAIGFDHSSGPYFPTETLFGPHTYDSLWDPMSKGYWTPSPATYGTLGVDYNVYHKDVAGWIAATRKFIALPGTNQTINLERLDSPTNTNYLMGQIWVPGSATQFYTVEARRKIGYDLGLPAEGVILHKVDTLLTDRQSQVVDTDNDGNPNTGSAIYTTGKSFTDTTNGIKVTVNSASTTGYNVTISVAASSLRADTVTNTKDSGIGSLRNAMIWANLFPNTTIKFHIPTSDSGYSNGSFVIKPLSPLPTLTTVGTIIDGASESAFLGITSTRPLIVIDGTQASIYGNGFMVTGANCTISTLVIDRFVQTGIWLKGCTGCKIIGCYIGTTPDGTASAQNANGVWVDTGAKTNTIGGTTTATRNVISGNTYNGVHITDLTTSGNIVSGNYIGLTPAGTGALPNHSDGIAIVGSTTNNIIGGTVAGSGNVISGNVGNGIYIGDGGTVGNLVQGNLIGPNALGKSAIANGLGGVVIAAGAASNTIGGTASGARNILSGNTYQGVYLGGSGTSSNTVSGNWIGIDITGLVALPNNGDGIDLLGGPTSNIIGGTALGSGNVIAGNKGNGIYIANAGTKSNLVMRNLIGVNAGGSTAMSNAYSGIVIANGAASNTIGGAAGAGNLIANSVYQGIYVLDSTTVGNTIRANQLSKNPFLGIDLHGGTEVNYGVTTNHIGTAAGPNNLQNYPVLTTASSGTGVTTITGTLNSLPSKTFTLDFYANTAAHVSGYGEGLNYLGAKTVTTDSLGNVTFSFQATGNAPSGFVTATATNNVTGDTSEFSKDLAVSGYTALPLVTLSPSIPNGSNSYYTLPVVVTLTPIAGNLGGVMTYTLDGGAAQTYSSALTISTDAAHTLTFTLTDSVGRVTASQTVTFKIDRTKPVTTASSVYSSGTAKVTLAATDNLAGVGSCVYTIDNGAQTTYSVPFSVSATSSHTVSFHSVDKAGNVEASKSLAITPPLPSAITNLTATGVSTTQINLAWTAAANATGYQIYRSTVSGGTRTSLGKVTTTSFSSTGLTPGTAYYYVVIPTNTVGSGPTSAEVKGTTVSNLPGTPTNVTATAVSASQINLTWTAASGATGYTIYRSTVPGTGRVAIGTTTTGLSFNNTGLSGATRYYYVVVATNLYGSTKSVEVSARTHGAPSAPTLTIAVISKSQINLTWTAADGATGYTVYRSLVAGTGRVVIGTTTTGLSFNNTGLLPSTRYYYVVVATNPYGSTKSAEVSGITPVL